MVKIKEYILVIEEAGGMMRIKGQFKVPNKTNLSKQMFSGIALTNAKAGEVVMVKI